MRLKTEEGLEAFRCVKIKLSLPDIWIWEFYLLYRPQISYILIKVNSILLITTGIYFSRNEKLFLVMFFEFFLYIYADLCLKFLTTGANRGGPYQANIRIKSPPETQELVCGISSSIGRRITMHRDPFFRCRTFIDPKVTLTKPRFILRFQCQADPSIGLICTWRLDILC